jgi:hypothetical protein
LQEYRKPELAKRFMTAWLVLMDAADRDPFSPIEVSDEEELFREFNYPEVIGVDHADRVAKLEAQRAATGTK